MDPAQIRPGWQTTEFYVTLLTTLGGISTLLFKDDYGLSSNAAAIAAGAAALASTGYAISRAITKRPVPTVMLAPVPAAANDSIPDHIHPAYDNALTLINSMVDAPPTGSHSVPATSG